MNNLYDVAKLVCHQSGFDWTDPRTGQKYKAPTRRKPKTRKKK